MEPGGEARWLLWHLCELSGVVRVCRRRGGGPGMEDTEVDVGKRGSFFF